MSTFLKTLPRFFFSIFLNVVLEMQARLFFSVRWFCILATVILHPIFAFKNEETSSIWSSVTFHLGVRCNNFDRSYFLLILFRTSLTHLRTVFPSIPYLAAIDLIDHPLASLRIYISNTWNFFNKIEYLCSGSSSNLLLFRTW